MCLYYVCVLLHQAIGLDIYIYIDLYIYDPHSIYTYMYV